MTQENHSLAENRNIYIPYDQYLYRRITDLCLEFSKTYQKLGIYSNPSDNLFVAKKLANIFMTIYDFASECEELPDYIRNPPLIEWDMKPNHEGCDEGRYNIHPRLANHYVMQLLNEIKRQQGEKKRAPDELLKLLEEDDS